MFCKKCIIQVQPLLKDLDKKIAIPGLSGYLLSYTQLSTLSYQTPFGCLNREEIRHENVPPRGKSVPNPVWDRWIGHANHS